jgi:hypothetical protein
MGYRNGDETVVIEARVAFSTAKAHLIEMTLGGECWLPKSQVVDMGEADMDGNREFTVTLWIAEKNGWV